MYPGEPPVKESRRETSAGTPLESQTQDMAASDKHIAIWSVSNVGRITSLVLSVIFRGRWGAWFVVVRRWIRSGSAASARAWPILHCATLEYDVTQKEQRWFDLDGLVDIFACCDIVLQDRAGHPQNTKMHQAQGLPTVGGGTESFWHADLHELDDYRSTEQLPEQSDIVIIGAGYAGVATAYHLLEAGSKASITLLEARGGCSGATGRNGGHLRPDLYGHIPTHIDRQGLEAGVEIAEFEAAHVTAIKNVVAKENIDCDLVITRSTDVWCNQDAAEKAKASYDKMVAYGLKHMDDVHFVMGKDAEGVSILHADIEALTCTD